MKGCLSLIIKLVIAVLVFFGLLHLGVIDFIKEKINQPKSQEEIIDKTKDLIDLSQIDEEYSVDKTFKVLKNRMIIAEHNATGQKMIMIEPKSENIFSKDDIKSADIQDKINTSIQKYKYKLFKIDKVDVVKHGELSGIGQKIPYVRVNVEISNLPVKDMEGILGVAELNNDKNMIVISVNEKGKYSQIITNSFFGKVKNAEKI